MQQMLEETKDFPLIGIDLEYFDAIRSEEDCGIISLMQISTYCTDYLFDTFMIRDILRSQEPIHGTLGGIYGDPSIVKIFHGSDNDLRYLISDLNIISINIFDTQLALNYIQKIP